MSQVWTQALAIARMEWLAMYNRGWRFSPRKSLALGLASEVALILWISRRVSLSAGQLDDGGLWGLVVLISLQMGWFGLMYGFSRGQFQLYTGVLVPLYQITPVRPISLLVGRVIEALPRRGWSTVLWAWAYAQLLPGPERWPAAALLAVIGILVSMLTHLSGLLAVTLWSRFSPRNLKRGLFAFFVLSLAGITWVVIYLTGGGSMVELTQGMRAARWYVLGGMMLLGGIPGLGLMVAFLFRPDAIENLYRISVYRVQELLEREDVRPLRSRWLPVPGGGALRAVVNREWITFVRSGGTRFRLAVWAAGTAGVWVAAPRVADRPFGPVLWAVGTLVLVSWLLAFGNQVSGAFAGERPTLPLYRLTGTAAGPVLAGKYLGLLLPAAVLVLMSGGVGAWRAGLSWRPGLALLGWLLLSLAAAVGATLGLAAATVPDEDDREEAAAGNLPGGDGGRAGPGIISWALARFLTLVATLGIGLWAGGAFRFGSWLPAEEQIALGLLLALPLAAMALGWWMLGRDWTATAAVAAVPKTGDGGDRPVHPQPR